jgi:hypothetical protein
MRDRGDGRGSHLRAALDTLASSVERWATEVESAAFLPGPAGRLEDICHFVQLALKVMGSYGFRDLSLLPCCETNR